jgi:hypothetical protein
MKLSSRRIDDIKYEEPRTQQLGRISFQRFFVRYPIFLLAFGPPIFRPEVGIDATKGEVDVWAFLQVGLLSLIALRAILRLANAKSIRIPKKIRSILRLSFFLGALFLASTAYSTSRLVTAAYAIFYFLTLICVAEFIVDVSWNPPNWMQCLFQLRLIALLLFVVVAVTLFIHPGIVMGVEPGAGLRLGGGAVAPVTIICPIIAIISAYAFLHSLESRVRSTFFFLAGLAGTLITQSRGSELALLLSLAIIGVGWAITRRRSAYIFLSIFIACTLLSAAVVGYLGPGRIWNAFNRGQTSVNFETGSGRTEIWAFVIKYCTTHPQGMGYIAGFRNIFKDYFAIDMTFDPKGIGSAHSALIQVLADAGWLALALYLILMGKIVLLGWRFAKKRPFVTIAPNGAMRIAIRCALLLLFFCFVNGTETDQYVDPLKTAFYFQNIIIAIILGASANMLIASRATSANSHFDL